MGIYTKDMYVVDFPITLPKLCAYFQLRTPIDTLVTNGGPEAILSVMKGSEKISSVTITFPSLETLPESRHGKPYEFFDASGAIEFPSMTFEEPTLIEVVAQVDGKSMIGGRLWVTKFPEDKDLTVTS
jgi:hypothetical protein